MLSREECRKNFAENCERIRAEKKLSQKEMAEILGMSLSSYRKILDSSVQTISAYTLYALCIYSGVPMSALFGDATEQIYMLHRFEFMTKQQKRFIKAIVDFEYNFYTQDPKNERNEITLMTPTGELHDGFDYDTCTYEKISIGQDYRRYEDRILCAVKLPSNFYSPAYVKGDILLMANDRLIRENEVGIFLCDGKAYLRRMVYDEGMVLAPVGDIGTPIRLSDGDLKKWTKFGYVLKKLR